jgi:hypothetical protein
MLRLANLALLHPGGRSFIRKAWVALLPLVFEPERFHLQLLEMEQSKAMNITSRKQRLPVHIHRLLNKQVRESPLFT